MRPRVLGVGRDQSRDGHIMHLVDFTPAALVGLFYLLRGEINMTRLRALISVKAVEHAVEDEKVAVADTS